MALGLGLATTLTLVASNLCVSLLRGLLRPEIRIPAFVLIIASVVTAIELLMRAYLHELYLVLGIFIPLIVTNCAIIGRAEAFASRNRAAGVIGRRPRHRAGFLPDPGAAGRPARSGRARHPAGRCAAAAGRVPARR